MATADREHDDRAVQFTGRLALLVLLVEDHADTLELYTDYLQSVAGFTVVENVTPETAFARALDARPNVVVTDYRMSPINGAELCRQLHAHPSTSHIPVIMLTGHTVAADLKVARTLCAAVLIKPCLPDQLVREIRRVAGRDVNGT